VFLLRVPREEDLEAVGSASRKTYASPQEPLASFCPIGSDRELVMITAHGLRKRYGDKVAVDDLSFDVRPGL
jgi:hypothetical protein